jgi:hypothetical protein
MLRPRLSVSLILLGLFCLPATAEASGPPSIQSEPPKQIRNKSALVQFSIDPEGLETTYKVQWGPTEGDYFPGHEGPFPLDAGTEYVELDEWITNGYTVPSLFYTGGYFEENLTPATTYHYRVLAWNSAGTTSGTDQSFTTTKEPAPLVVTGAASDITPTTVTLHGTIDPEGLPVTKCTFHYVEKTSYDHRGFEAYGYIPIGRIAPCTESPEEIGSGDDPVSVHLDLSGLEAGIYYFRLEADNGYEKAIPGNGVAFELPAVEQTPVPMFPGDGGSDTPPQASSDTPPPTCPFSAKGGCSGGPSNIPSGCKPGQVKRHRKCRRPHRCPARRHKMRSGRRDQPQMTLHCTRSAAFA